MDYIPKTDCDKAMRFIIDFYKDERTGHHITVKSLMHLQMYDSMSEYRQLAIALRSMKLITIGNDSDKDAIVLTDEGNIYFESEAYEAERMKKQHLHDWKIAIASLAAGAFFSEPFWRLLHKLWALIQNHP